MKSSLLHRILGALLVAFFALAATACVGPIIVDDGIDGEDGEDVIVVDGEDGQDGDDGVVIIGEDGQDGDDVLVEDDGLIDNDNQLQVTYYILEVEEVN